MNESTVRPAAAGHCTNLPAGTQWADAALAPAAYEVSGASLDASVTVLEADCVVGSDAPTAGEEVGAVLEGRFEVEAAGERYVLCRGEGIVIPPGAPRRWRCLTARGVVYRVSVKPAAGSAQ
ncbi:cupin domain-containing protein [Burkholderia sp. MR1-5-21]